MPWWCGGGGGGERARGGGERARGGGMAEQTTPLPLPKATPSIQFDERLELSFLLY